MWSYVVWFSFFWTASKSSWWSVISYRVQIYIEMIGKKQLAWLDCVVSADTTCHMSVCHVLCMYNQALLTHNSPTIMHRDEKMLAYLTLTRIFCTRQAKPMIPTILFTIRCHRIHTQYYPLYPITSIYNTVYWIFLSSSYSTMSTGQHLLLLQGMCCIHLPSLHRPWRWRQKATPKR